MKDAGYRLTEHGANVGSTECSAGSISCWMEGGSEEGNMIHITAEKRYLQGIGRWGGAWNRAVVENRMIL